MRITILFLLFCILTQTAFCGAFELPEFGDYEVFSMPGEKTKLSPQKGLFKETPRNAISEDGLCGFFVSETAERLAGKRMFSGIKYYFNDLTNKRNEAYRAGEDGSVSTIALSAVYIGDWAEWSVVVPIHMVSVAAPRLYKNPSLTDQGIGDLKLGWKATYLRDRSYYRGAYGAVAYASTGDPENTGPAGPRRQDELKLFGCVTTKETDNAVGNFEIGTILNSVGEHNRFIYRFGLSYEATAHASLIGELSGEIEGGDDRDNLDMVTGIRLSPTPTSVFEFSYTKNLRTFREYGWDDRLQAGATIRW